MPEFLCLKRWYERRWLWTLLAVLAAVAIAVGSLTPGSEMPERLPWDKFNHFVGYAGLAGLVGLTGWRPASTFLIVAFYGIVIEYLQMVVPGRSGGDWQDILANSLGAAIAVLLLKALRWGAFRRQG